MRSRFVAPPSSAAAAGYAHFMRHHPSVPEVALWHALSGRRLGGVRFRRQVPAGPFVADFLAPQHKLIVEVDGAQHARRRGADVRRDKKLRRWGCRVLRLDAQLVLRELPAALARICEALGLEE